jgi:hypothetical protein
MSGYGTQLGVVAQPSPPWDSTIWRPPRTDRRPALAILAGIGADGLGVIRPIMSVMDILLATLSFS